MWDDKLNYVHQTAIVDELVTMGTGNYIGPYCFIGPGVVLGNGNRIQGYASIGTPAEHRNYFTQNDGQVIIGSRNTIREFTTINRPTLGVTRMGDDCVMLRGSHLSHDSILEDRVNVSCNVLIGGESYIYEGANLGLGCILHQYQVVGAYAMLGMGAVFPKGVDIEPGGIYVGNPAKWIKFNKVGLDRAAVSQERLAELRASWAEKRLGIK